MASKKSSRRPTRSTATTSTTKKSAPAKRVTTKRTESTAMTGKPEASRRDLNRKLAMNKWYLIAGLVIVLIAGLLYLLRSYFIAAMVNGQPISRFSVISELERQSGKQ